MCERRFVLYQDLPNSEAWYSVEKPLQEDLVDSKEPFLIGLGMSQNESLKDLLDQQEV